MGVDVCREGLLSLDLWVGNPTVFQSKTLQLSWLTGQLPVHLHGCLVQDLSEETGRTGNYGTDGDKFKIHIVRRTFSLSSIVIMDCCCVNQHKTTLKDGHSGSAGLTAPLCCGGDGVGLLASSQSRIRLQVDGVGGGCFQVVDLVSEGVLTDGLLQLCAVWF